MEILSQEEILRLSPEDQREYLELIEQYEEIRKYNKLNFFEPYPFQKKFYDKGADNNVRALIAANRCGKTYSAAMELAMHLTGSYPAWWDGRKFEEPVKVVASAVTASQCRDVLQKELLGTENRDIIDDLGTGSIPKHALMLDESTKARDGAYSEIYVKHSSGGASSVKFFAQSQGMQPMQGFTAHIVVIDEQCPDDIFSELVKRTATVDGIVIMTFTPLQGVTHLVKQFWEKDGAFHDGMVNAGWDDVTHLTDNQKQTMLNATPPHLQDAVTKGIPVLGAGAVFNIGEEEIVFQGLEIQESWEHMIGLDIGFTNDPTAAILAARDPSTGVIYIYGEYGDRDNNVLVPSQHVGSLHRLGASWKPVAYDSAANSKTGASGASVADMYREMGLNMLSESFKNPRAMRQNATSYKAILPGLVKMQEMMLAGKLKIHATACPNWWREFKSYAYDDKGVPSVTDNHWMDASRYAVMSILRDLGQSNGFSMHDYYDSGDDWNHY